ncbi:hypothetical protein Tco_0951588 [Tanacetum coccineum]|uniref:Uncharacterized protein n=1 Tax=Tanacetum coccineum TaxID=301880 RepID=A0ABQ5DWC2_9ASTR
MLAPRSAKALHVLIPENSHGKTEITGSSKFFVLSCRRLSSISSEGKGIDVRWLGIGALTGSKNVARNLDVEIGLVVTEDGDVFGSSTSVETSWGRRARTPLEQGLATLIDELWTLLVFDDFSILEALSESYHPQRSSMNLE